MQCVHYTYIYVMCYRFVLICLVEATHAQNFYHSLQGNGLSPPCYICITDTYDRPVRENDTLNALTRAHNHLHAVNVTHTCIAIIHDIRAKGMVRLVPIPVRWLPCLMFETCIWMNEWIVRAANQRSSHLSKNVTAKRQRTQPTTHTHRKKHINQKSSTTNATV